MVPDDIQQLFLDLLRLHLNPSASAAPVSVSPEALQGLMGLSQLHQVTPMVVDALGAGACLAPDAEALFALWKRQAMGAVFAQTRRTQAFAALCAALEQAQIPAVVFKGILLRILYPKMDFRTSSDEDIYIPEAYDDAARQVFQAQGMQVAAGDEPAAQVTTYVCPITGLRVEVHRSLFPELAGAGAAMNSLFQGIEQRRIAVKWNGASLYGMPHTEHMLYLIFHALKHFVHAGFGIRQVCDINLYAAVHWRDIDWKRVSDSLRLCRAQVFAAGIWAIGARFLGFPDRGYIPVAAPDPLPLLQDVLTGGVYGSSTEDRQHASLITLSALSAAKSIPASLRGAIFPPLEQMAAKYPYLRRRPWLLPAAWSQRIAGYLRKGGRVSPTASISIGSQRVALLRRYGLL